MTYAPASLERWSRAVFEACGMPAGHAETSARLLVRSELRGYATHGMTRVASYVERLDNGAFNPRPTISHRAFPGGVVLEADGAMGQVAGPMAIALGRAELERSASVLVVIRECGHLGALGIHALEAAEAGLFCVLGQRTPPLLAMPGFTAPAIGHNPIAFGCPVPQGPPLVFDIACSVAARGHILLAAREGRPIPEGWAVDETGAPTTDARRALAGSLMPMGGHKGVGIAMMVECLAGALGATADAQLPSRDRLPETGAVGRQGGFLWLVRPGAFGEAAPFEAAMSHWTQGYVAAGAPRARLPGSRGARMEAHARLHGVSLPPAIVAELSALGTRLGLPFPEASGAAAPADPSPGTPS
jgi:LDH2 family malate/lactate/ureidoglycolate dehydrogenase